MNSDWQYFNHSSEKICSECDSNTIVSLFYYHCGLFLNIKMLLKLIFNIFIV